MSLKMFTGLLFLTMSVAIQAGLLTGSLKTVQGQVSTNRKNFDFTRVKVRQFIICRQGWGDGRHGCGEKSSEAQVDKDGKFVLPGLKGENYRWSEARFEVEVNDKVLFRSMWDLSAENNNAIKSLLQKFTLYYFEPFELNLKLDTDLDFDNWIKVFNRDYDVGGIYRLSLMKPSAELSTLNKMIIHNEKEIRTKASRNDFDFSPEMLAGNLKEALANYSVSYFIRSREGQNIMSSDIAVGNVSLADPLFYEKLSDITLNVSNIKYTLDGFWRFHPDFTLNRGNDYFYASDPFITLNTRCVDNKLTGSARLEYRRSPELNTVMNIEGSCGFQKAEFSLRYVVTNYNNPNDRITLNGKFLIKDIAGAGAVYELYDGDSGNKLSIYGSAMKCKQDNDQCELAY